MGGIVEDCHLLNELCYPPPLPNYGTAPIV